MSDIESILPSNSTPLELALEQVINRPIPNLIGDMWNPDTCPAELLGYLAFSLAVEVWDDGWTESIKRQVIKSSIPEYEIKGTVAAVKLALSKAGLGDNQIVEGRNNFTYDGSASYDGFPLYSDSDGWNEYKVILQGLLSVDQANIAKDLLAKAAPARCELWGFDFTQAIPLYNGEINYDGIYTMGVV
ncbi:phage tail protein I [Hydrogenovibrio sp. 3SP14C1]|uniref:phage tail protein I n=1 Tax=Hydrogenovibrio sp. 3SP14C1 TaxID=3038774 RepID=UPI002415B8FD|nr:phage tail protein I [Hydrogenovibrio sp. 3SP14C1]MDG4811935.1 phage tail protein I [Hydrogenovibrio sp. 3SP14C1]